MTSDPSARLTEIQLKAIAADAAQELQRIAAKYRDLAAGAGRLAPKDAKLQYYVIEACGVCGRQIHYDKEGDRTCPKDGGHVWGPNKKPVVELRGFTPQQIRILVERMDVFDLAALTDDVAEEL